MIGQVSAGEPLPQALSFILQTTTSSPVSFHVNVVKERLCENAPLSPVDFCRDTLRHTVVGFLNPEAAALSYTNPHTPPAEPQKAAVITQRNVLLRVQ